ncbi:MAG TPA: glycosyltransferase family 4 protein [Gemmatimonadota bacterium]|nr:glycosyltransferase family 4 protein [Gemmatimonadota bacterium]
MKIFHCDVRRVWAGGQTQLLRLAVGLRERGHLQWIVTRPESPLAGRARKEGFEVLAHPFRGEVDPRATLGLRRMIARHAPEVVHTHDTHSLTPAALAARLVRPRPLVVAHRRVDFHIRANAFSRWKYAHGADHLIAVSRRVKEVLVEDGVPPSRVTVIHSGIALDTPPPPEGPDLRTRAGAPAGTPLVLTIASTEAYKDHPTLIDAAGLLFERRPDVWWAVLGTGGLFEATLARAERRGLADRLRYLGFVEGARGLLPQADLFVLTSRTEGLGTSILDAMAAGIPVVATAAGGIPEMVDHERTGLLVPPGDAAALALAIERVLGDPALGRRLADAARVRVRDFDVGRTIERTEELYGRLLADRRPPDGPAGGRGYLIRRNDSSARKGS